MWGSSPTNWRATAHFQVGDPCPVRIEVVIGLGSAQQEVSGNHSQHTLALIGAMLLDTFIAWRWRSALPASTAIAPDRAKICRP